jgi:hypothetical protein
MFSPLVAGEECGGVFDGSLSDAGGSTLVNGSREFM